VPPRPATLGAVLGWGAVTLLLGDSLFPRRRILVLPNLAMAATSIFLCAQLVRLATPVTDAVVLDSPVRGVWYVGSGGRSVLLNHHYPVAQQRNALDVMMARHAASGSTDPRSFPAFGQTVYAPAAGTVVAARDDLPDLPIGTADRVRPEGNHVVLDIGGNRYVLLAHLQRGSAEVTAGQRVSAGQPVARVGNSGNTAEPHLHLQVQDRPRLIAPDGRSWTRGLRTFPVELRATVRIRDGVRTTPAADLRRNDILQTP
jgi:biotin carboxyl carrier protein